MIVWLASYPRSGNTFVRSALKHYFGKRSYSVYGDRYDIGSNSRLSALVGHEAGDSLTLNIGELRDSDDLVFIKTHELPGPDVFDEDLIFYIVRDGRNACGSFSRYLTQITKEKDVTLQRVLMGDAGGFGLWGNHVLRWYQANPSQTHIFKFEKITAQPDAFADRLSDILDLERSHEAFPDFDTFKQAMPSFFGAGLSGAHTDVFSPADDEVFQIYNGPAMKLAGYGDGDIADVEIAAYDVFCQLQTQVRDMSAASIRLKQRQSILERELSTLKKRLAAADRKYEELRHEHQLLQRRYADMRAAYDALRDRYNTVLRYTGLATIQSVLRWYRAATHKQT